MKSEIGGEIPSLEKVLESDRTYFEENPGAEWGMRLPHPEEWPMVPTQMLEGMCVIVTKLAPNIRGRQLVDLRLWMLCDQKRTVFPIIIIGGNVRFFPE